MERLNIDVVPKSANPPNVPQLRPIENFWANLKCKIYSNNFVAKTVEELIKKKTKKELKNMATRMFSSAMANLPVNCREAARKDVILFCEEANMIPFHGKFIVRSACRKVRRSSRNTISAKTRCSGQI